MGSLIGHLIDGLILGDLYVVFFSGIPVTA
jgi:hypothetical protein